MEPNEDYSMMHVVNHLKYCMGHNYSRFYLTLEYKFAKPNEPVQGNKKFKEILKKSHEETIVMNANRETKRTDYVHLISMASPKQFQSFKENIKTLNKIHKTKSQKCEKVDLNWLGEKITFDSEKKAWSYKNKKNLFRPNYETVKNGKLFRISLVSQAKGNYEPKKKVIDILESAINRVLEVQKEKVSTESLYGQKDKIEPKKSETTYQKIGQKHSQGNQGPSDRQPPLRFKQEQTIILNNCFSIVMSSVYQVINIKLYQNIRDLVKARKYSSSDIIGRELLSEMVQEIFGEMKNDLTYEIELRFNPEYLREFEDLDEEEIYNIMDMTGQIFVSLVKDQKEFSAEEIIALLDKIEKA